MVMMGIQILLPALLAVMLLLPLMLALGLKKEAFSMRDMQALVFEVYRYAVCFVMLITFTIMTYILLAGFFADPGNFRNAAGPALGTLLSVSLFIFHWRMKNPAGSPEGSS